MSLPGAKIFDPFRGKPFRRLQREVLQRVYSYPQRNLFIIGQPKSGSTWLFKMVQDVPGYMPWTPNYIKFERHDLQPSWAAQVPAGFTVTKTHTPPSDENRAIIRDAGRPFVVLLRDLRDIAVSWCFYVGNTPDHPRHEIIQPLPINKRLDYFIETMLPIFAPWSRGWYEHHHVDGLGLMVRYEELLADPSNTLGRVLRHYEIDASAELLGRIVQRHTFQRSSGGRAQGEEDSTAFVRKGIVGDWVNHFEDHHRVAFDEAAGDVLRELGYDA